MNNEIKIEKTLPTISGVDFEMVKAELEADLEKYKNVVVTPETLNDDKKLAISISGKAKAYAKIRKDTIDEISKPIVAFSDQMKKLEGMCTDLSNTIKKQVKVFNDQKLKEISAEIYKELGLMREAESIADEFIVIGVADALTKLTAITKTGKLTSSTRKSLSEIVSSEKSLMQTTNLRLAQLESESYKAGLDIPLVRLNVEQFLFDTDEMYNEHLAKAIESEFNRQQAAKARKAELDSKLSQNNHDPEKENKEQPQQGVKLRSYQANTVEPEQPNDGKVSYTATAIFKLRVPSSITEQRIAAKLEEMMTEAGITSLHSVGVMKDA